MKIASASRVYVLGVLLCLALTIASRNFTDRGGPGFMAGVVAAGIAYLLAVREFFNTQKFSRRVVVIGLLLAAVWTIEFLRLPSGPDDDIHRYVWDGRLQRLGYSPYLVIPSDPVVQALHTPETRTLNNPDLPSLYPPGAELFFRAVTAIRESTYALKVAFVLCEFANVFLLLDILRSKRRAAHLVLVYAWNPLLAIEIAGSGHIDIFGVMLLVISIAALVRRWKTVAAVALGLAVAVKFLPIVLVPFYWKRVRIRDAALAALAVVFLYVPFLNHGRIPIGSLATYLQTFRFNGPVFAALAQLAPPQLIAGLAVLAGFITAAWLRHKTPDLSPSAFAWPMAVALLCAPAVFPWYLVWLLPFLTSSSTLLLVIWTVSVIPVYVQWHLRTLGRPWGALPVWVMLVEYGCLALAAAIILMRRRTRSSARPAQVAG